MSARSENTLYPTVGQMSLDFTGDDPAAPRAVPMVDLTHEHLKEILDIWVAAGWLRSVDRAVARLMVRAVPTITPWAVLALVFASHQAGQGHVCLDLAVCLADPDNLLKMPPKDSAWAIWRQRIARADALDINQNPLRPAQFLQGVTLSDWLVVLDGCPKIIGRATGFTAYSSHEDGENESDDGATPFIRDGARLYLRRYWQQEQTVARQLRQRVQPATHLPESSLIRPILDALFPANPAVSDEPDWQKIACAVAIRHQFALITGGPGTGKTTTVVKFLILTQLLALSAGLSPKRIRLCAPTGKAAARLRQSLLSQIDTLVAPFAQVYPELRAALPDTVETVHRLIGIRPDQIQAHYHAGAPLPADVVVMDEASMIGLELMANTLAALDSETQLIMLGDKDQLASVEPGAVLGALSKAAAMHPGAYALTTAEWIFDVTGTVVAVNPTQSPLAEATVWLRHSHRFNPASPIAKLAHDVNTGDAASALALLTAQGESPSAIRLLRDDPTRSQLRAAVLAALGPWLQLAATPWSSARSEHDSIDDWALAVFAAHQQVQVLCALRNGAYGVVGLNAWIEHLLQQAGLIAPARTPGGWYAGRPIIVTRNDAALRLANGDVGLTLPYIDPDINLDTPTPPSQLRVAFLSDTTAGTGSPAVRWMSPNRLVAVETAFALTVHKAQGSEFTHSILVLPAVPNPVLTRELIYTAITRARSVFTLVVAAQDSSLNVLRQGVLRQVKQSGQLGELLQN